MDKPSNVAFNSDAPQQERFDAQSEMQQAAMPRAMSDLIPAAHIQPVIDWINRDLEDQAFNKSLQFANVIPLPSKHVKQGKPGMQSVYLDELQIAVMGDYYEKPGYFGFEAMRQMVEQTPVLSAVIFTRIRQVQRFCSVQEAGIGPGFEVRLKDRAAQAGPDEKQSIKLLQDFMLNCGWETRPRQRLRMRRDNLTGLMTKLVRDSLTMDSAPIETEWKRDKSLGLDGLYAVDGATIRLCSEDGYRGEDEIFALQVVQGNIRSAYSYDDLIYVPRNQRTDVMSAGYGLSETELLIKTVTGFLNAMTYNLKYFDSNQIPKGLLHLNGNYSEQDLAAFRRYWSAMTKGIQNAWNMPYMVSKDQESKVSFEKFGVDVDEMMFSKWMTFLTSIICAIYSIAPDEINFDSFSGGNTSPLSGSDTETRLTASKDKGLRPLLSHFEGIFSDYVISEFSDKYVFRWTGLDEEDEEKRHEIRKLVLTVDEMRAQENLGKHPDPVMGAAPLNPSLNGVYMQTLQKEQEDYGDPSQAGDAPAGAPVEDEGNEDAADGEDASEASDTVLGDGEDERSTDTVSTAPASDTVRPAEDDREAMAKAFGLPVLRVE